MKKITFLFLTLLFSLIGYSQTEYLDGVIVLNEGGTVTQGSSISFISPTNQVANNIFGLANPRVNLGNVAQSLSFSGDVAVVALNMSNQVKIVNSKTFQLIDSIPGLINPRYSAVYNGKAYVTCWGTSSSLPGYLAVINLGTNTLETTIALTSGSERIKEVNGKLYIAHVYTNLISVYDIATATMQQITVNNTPSGFALLGNDLYVLCGLQAWLPATTTASLLKINTATNTIVSTQNLPIGIKAFHMDTNGTDLFIGAVDKVYKFTVATQTFNATPIITTNITGVYGLYGFNVINNKIYIADAGNFISPGIAYTYSVAGTLLNTFTVGVMPNGFYKSKEAPLAIDKHNKDNVKIYPNPTSDILNIQTEEELIKVEVYNLQGQKVLSTNNVNSIDVSSLQTGVYILKAQTTNGLSSVKFVKK